MSWAFIFLRVFENIFLVHTVTQFSICRVGSIPYRGFICNLHSAINALLVRTQIICIATSHCGEGVWKKSGIFLNMLEF